MANFTIELREIVESGRNIFPFQYDFYDEKKRLEFERAFIRHFYFREIGVPTVDRFIFNLQDKMATVFPYYNKLFATAQMEYNILDNYYITEKTEKTQENRGRFKGKASSVGRDFGEAQSVSDYEGNASEVNSENVLNESERSESLADNKETTNHETVTATQTDVKKFLDTPQGAVNLDDNKYVTTLNHDVEKKDTEKNLTENVVDNQTITGTQNSETETNGTKTNNSESKTEITQTTEQKRSEDSNSNSESERSDKTVMEFTRRGNIGVDTDADMLQKHIKLQKVLQQIELMFFNECEDLFMLVWE